MPVQFQPASQAAPIAVKKPIAPAHESSGKLAARLVLRGVAQTAEFAGGMAALAAGFASVWLTINASDFRQYADYNDSNRGTYINKCADKLPLLAFLNTNITVDSNGKPICTSPDGIVWKDNKNLALNAADNQFLVGMGLAAASIVISAIGHKVAAIARDWEQQIAGASPQSVK